MFRLYVDTRDRVAGTPSMFAISLPEDIVVKEETYGAIDMIAIPNSWYLIDEQNNNSYCVFHG